MPIRISGFKGEVPKVHPRLLAENFAQVAVNTRLEDGTIGPIRQTKLAHTLDADAVSFTAFNGDWLGFDSIVDAVPGPVATDRLYYTGSGAPKMRVGSTIYALALAAPAAAPSLSLGSAPVGDTESVLYCYTFVTSFGEESQPSPIAGPVSVDTTVTVTVSGFSAAPSGRGITAIRIYRSQTSLSGVTAFYFVAEVAVGTSSYAHDILAAPLQEPLPSTDYDPPPSGMLGLTSLPNGMMAAFLDKELLFCEPFQPHAWPIKYALKVDSPIVGLAAFGSTLVVLTSATPYVVQGTHPDSMVMERMDNLMPCLSRRGIVDIGYAALFPTNDGLAMISPSNSQIVTQPLFTRDQWRELAPDSFVAKQYAGRYVFTYVAERGDTFVGGGPDDVATDTFSGGPVAVTPGLLTYGFGTPASVFGEQAVGVLDIGTDGPFFVRSTVDVPTAMYSKPETGGLFMLVADRSIVEWDSESAPRAVQVWRSKSYELPTPRNFGVVFIESDAVSAGGNILKARVYADGHLQREVTQANEPQRLPANRMARRWEIEVEANFAIKAITLAETMDDVFQ